jgi:hypothetical protein
MLDVVFDFVVGTSSNPLAAAFPTPSFAFRGCSFHGSPSLHAEFRRQLTTTHRLKFYSRSNACVSGMCFLPQRTSAPSTSLRSLPFAVSS